MSRGTNLKSVRQMVKAELGNVLAPGVNLQTDALLNRKIVQTQLWLSTEFEWPFLRGNWDYPVAVDQRYVDVSNPLTNDTIDFDRNPQAWIQSPSNQANAWYPLQYGILPEHYNLYESTTGAGGYNQQTSSPVRRWQLYSGGPPAYEERIQVELWPIPSEVCNLRFRGQRKLQALPTTLVDTPNLVNNNGTPSGDDALILDLDDLLLAYYVAASMSTQNKELSAAMASKSRARFNQLRTLATNTQPSLVLGGPVRVQQSDTFYPHLT